MLVRDKQEKSLGGLCRRFVQLFLVGNDVVSVAEAAEKLSDPEDVRKKKRFFFFLFFSRVLPLFFVFLLLARGLSIKFWFVLRPVHSAVCLSYVEA